MTYNPISGAAVQYSKSNGQVASGYWLKFYIANTTTPLSMAIDSAGSSPLLKCKLNDKGYPITNENDNTTVFIPYVNQDYRFVLYKNEEDADADLTSSADVNIASVSSLAGAANSIFTVASISALPPVVIGNKVDVTSYHAGLNVGGGSMVGEVGRHDGVLRFDPNRAGEIGTAAYYVDSGVDANCWVRDYHDGSIDNAGARSTTGDSVVFAALNTVAIQSAVNLGGEVIVPIGTYEISDTITLKNEGQIFRGESRIYSIIDASNTAFVGFTAIDVIAGRLQTIKDLFIRGRRTADGYAANARALTISDGQGLHLERVTVKNGDYGIWYRGGNSNRWVDVFAESCYTGIRVDPFVASDTNGCVMKGIRAFNCRDWGIDIAEGDIGSVGHMHSRWECSAEGNNTDSSGATAAGGGIRVRGGVYCTYDLYSEGNEQYSGGGGLNFDLPTNAPHFYFLKNPESSPDGALLQSSLAAGIRTQGGVQYFDAGISPKRVNVKDFPASGSIGGNGISIYEVTNSSGGSVNLDLAMLSYMPVGSEFTVLVRANSNGSFNLVPPAGITLIGDTQPFGGFAYSLDVLRLYKISSTEVLCKQLDSNNVNGTLGALAQYPATVTTLNSNGIEDLADQKVIRIGADEVVRINTTDNNPAINNLSGASLKPTGEQQLSRFQGPSLLINRFANNGNAAEFKRDGLTVGSVAVSTSAASYYTTTSVFFTSGSGSPEGVVTAPVGSIYTRIDGGAGTTLYIKESGTGNTGWIAK